MLQKWVRRLEARSEEARQLTNGTTYRIWRLYMAGAANRFRAARGILYQTRLVKSDRDIRR